MDYCFLLLPPYTSAIPAQIQHLSLQLFSIFFLRNVSLLRNQKSMYFLAAGFMLHGVFDFVYSLFPGLDLLPPHYDWFCLSVDWAMGIYLFVKIQANYIRCQKSLRLHL